MAPGRRSCCSRFHQAIELVGRRWTGVILYVLSQRDSRFAEIIAQVPDLTPRMLSERLRELEAEGIIERSVLTGNPPGVEYALTTKGRELVKALRGVGDWARRWLPEDSHVIAHK